MGLLVLLLERRYWYDFNQVNGLFRLCLRMLKLGGTSGLSFKCRVERIRVKVGC